MGPSTLHENTANSTWIITVRVDDGFIVLTGKTEPNKNEYFTSARMINPQGDSWDITKESFERVQGQMDKLIESMKG